MRGIKKQNKSEFGKSKRIPRKLFIDLFNAFTVQFINCECFVFSGYSLPSWLIEFRDDSHGKNQIKLNPDCRISLDTEKCTTIMRPLNKECQNLLSLSNMLLENWDSKDLFKRVKELINPKPFYISNIAINHCNDELGFQSKNQEVVKLLDNYLFLDDVNLNILFENYSFQNKNPLRTSIKLNGTLTIDQNKVLFYIVKKDNDEKNYENDTFKLVGYGNQLSFKDLLTTFRMMKSFYKKLCRDIDKQNLERVLLKSVVVKGNYQYKKNFHIIFTGKLSQTDQSIEILINRVHARPIKIAVILKGKVSESILPFMRKVIRENENEIPILDKNFNYGIFTLSGYQIHHQSKDLIGLNEIPKGIILQTISKFEGYKELIENRDFEHNVRLFPTKLTICNKRDTIEFSPDAEIQLEKFLEQFEQQGEIKFPDWLKTDESVTAKIKSVEYEGANKEKVTVKAMIIIAIKLFGNVEIQNIEVEFITSKSTPEDGWRCGQLSQKKKLNNLEADLTLTCDDKLTKFRLVVTMPTVDFNSILKLLKLDVIPDALKKSLNKLIDFQIKGFRFETSKGDDNFMR